MRKKDSKYAIGLDIGTGSVGWAAMNDSYELVKVNNQDAWGVVLFDNAQTAKDRRLFRSGRRRIERRKVRVRLLQELMAEDIAPVDKNFYIRLQESSYHQGEGKYFRSNHYNLFDGGEYTDADYYHEFPTIYHLREKLVESDEKADIRLVYLALHHIIKYRGHFLNEGGADSIEGGPRAAADELFSLLLNNYDKDLCFIGKEEDFVSALSDSKKSRSIRAEEAYNVLTKEKKDKFITALTKAAVGLKADLTDLLCIEDEEGAIKDENGKAVTICFADAQYEERKEDYASLERADILFAAEKLYAAVELNNVLRGRRLLCQAMTDKFKKHAKDLYVIRKLIRSTGDKELYNGFFRKSNGASYTGYIGDKRYGFYGGKNDKYVKTTKEELYKRVKDILTKYVPDCPDKEYVIEQMDKDDFLPLITSKDNAYVPYQLNLKELDAILEKQGKFHPCLRKNADKIRSLLTFRRPYYVGPLKGKFGWTEGVDIPKDVRITPWNFNEAIGEDGLDKLAENFISRMTNDCSLIKGEPALPLNSMLYQEYMVLNEINKIKVFDKPISIEEKKAIFDLCKARKTVKKTDIANCLNKNFNMAAKADDIGGLSDEKKVTASLSTFNDFKKAFGEDFVNSNFDALEEAVRVLTIFTDKDIRIKRIKALKVFDGKEEYLAKKNFSGWGKYSRKALYETLGNGGKCVLDLMYETNKHVNEILFDEELGFKDKFINKQEQIEKFTYEQVNDMRISPVVRRSVWNALKLTDELVKQIGGDPMYIFLEDTTEIGEKKRTKSKYDKVYQLYQAIRGGEYADIEKECRAELVKYKENKSALDNDKLYLWFIQLGKSMYSGKVIPIGKLGECEIDHIIPRSLVPDNSFENRVLVLKEENQAKGDRPVTTDIVKRMDTFWEFLYKHGFIGSKKYANLHKTEITEDDIRGFINRQLNDTGYIVRMVKELLMRRFPNADIRGIKPKLSSIMRKRFAEEGKAGFYKIRGLNNFHHAKDAYLAAVTGMFTAYSCPLWGQDRYNKALNYYIGHMEESRYKHTSTLVNKKYGFIVNLMTRTDRPDLIDIDEETGEYLWDTNRFNNVLETMSRNTCRVVRVKSRKAKSAFYDQAPLGPNGKVKGLIPMKNKDGEPMPPELYGGYSNENAEYFLIVKVKEEKKGKIKESYEFKKVPVRISICGEEVVKEYLSKFYGEEVEIVNTIYKNQLIRYRKKPGERGQLCYIASENEVQNAEEVYFNDKFEKLLYLCEKNIEAIEEACEKDPDCKYPELMKEFVKHYCYVVKLRLPMFEGFAQKLLDALSSGVYDQLTVREKAELINHMLIVSHSGAARVKINAKLGGSEVGRLGGKTIDPTVVDWIDMPLTGLYTRIKHGI